MASSEDGGSLAAPISIFDGKRPEELLDFLFKIQAQLCRKHGIKAIDLVDVTASSSKFGGLREENAYLFSLLVLYTKDVPLQKVKAVQFGDGHGAIKALFNHYAKTGDIQGPRILKSLANAPFESADQMEHLYMQNIQILQSLGYTLTDDRVICKSMLHGLVLLGLPASFNTFYMKEVAGRLSGDLPDLFVKMGEFSRTVQERGS